MNTIDVAINEFSIPIVCCVGLGIYMVWLIRGKEAEGCKIKSCIYKFGFLIIPYAGNRFCCFMFRGICYKTILDEQC